MNDFSRLEAAMRSIRLSTMQDIIDGKRTGTDIISCEAILPPWSPEGLNGDGNHEIGEPCTHEGKSWKCCQAHNSITNPDIEPGKSPAQWAPYHTTDASRAKPFIQPTGAHDAYLKGEVCLWTDGVVYRSVLETANVHSPEEYPQGWDIEGSDDNGE